MQATHGFAVLLRSRTRSVGCAVAVALALSALGLASTASGAEPPRKTYLALGDSVAFGYSQQLFNENFPTEPATAFEHGYVNDYLNLLVAKQTPVSTWAPVVNNGCPGETTDSFIGNGSMRAQMEAFGLPVKTKPGSWLESTVTTAPCAYHNVNHFELHHDYGELSPTEPLSQLENGAEVIQKDTGEQHPVSTITLNIGANDELRAIAKCEREVKAELAATGNSKYNKAPYVESTEEAELAAAGPKEKYEAGFNHCIKAHVGEIFHHILNNIYSIAYVIRHGSLFCVKPGPPGPCAAKRSGVDYAGKILVLGGYDPYGSVFEETKARTATEPEDNDELLPGSNFLAGILNIDESELVTEPSKGIDGCFANPQPKFNPFVIGHNELEWGEGALGSLISTGHGGKLTGANDRGEGATGGIEPDPSPLGTLQKFTNMTNFTVSRGLKYGEKEANGPDIHPTPLGYEEIANVITSQCP
jgi:lysophospholipase L1-like esterase